MPRGVFTDLTGQRFGRLTVLGLESKDGGRCKWRCLCDCGKECVCRTDAFKTQRSCGCIRTEKNVKRFFQHGGARTSLYRILTRLKQATSNPNYCHYANYGGKGVKLAEEWKDWETFKAWALAHGYKKGLHLHRKDSNGDYSPENCIWLTVHEQQKLHGRLHSTIIEQVDDGGNVVARFNGYREITEKLGIDTGGVRRSMREGFRCHGYRWRHASTQ